MKKNLKTYLACGITAASIFSGVAFSGCTDGPTMVDKEYTQLCRIDSDLNIIVDGIMHKGDIYTVKNGDAGAGLTGLDLYCGGDGIEVYTIDVKAYNKDFKPGENQHYELCEKCFGE